MKSTSTPLNVGDIVTINEVAPKVFTGMRDPDPTVGAHDSFDEGQLGRLCAAYGGRNALVKAIRPSGRIDLLHPADNPDTETVGFPPEAVTLKES